VRRLAEATGKSLTEVVIEALRDKWEQEQRRAAFPTA
jgi:hypothetical protein